MRITTEEEEIHRKQKKKKKKEHLDELHDQEQLTGRFIHLD